jgi:hypothetical protein
MMIFILLCVIIYSVVKWYKESINITSFEQEYARYLIRLGNKNFFCYNNSRRSQEYVEKYVIPLLPSNVEIIFLNGKIPISDYPEIITSALLFKLQNFNGFPHLIKLREGHTSEKSINNLTYNCINQNKEPHNILIEVISFFD